MDGHIDYRFTMANERTYLAWIRTALGLVAVGLAAGKALEFNHEVYRWIVAVPPIAGGVFLAVQAGARWRSQESAMAADEPLAVGRGIKGVGVALCVYAIVALAAMILDG